MNHDPTTTRRLPAEWEPQDAVLLAWPHGKTDWAEYLDEVQAVYDQIIRAIIRFERVILVAPEAESLQGRWPADRVQIHPVPTNDTWARDFGPITVMEGGRPRLLDFRFSGWGDKFAADLDDQVTRSLHGQGLMGKTPLEINMFALEAGSIESDGKGTVLTTTTCLLNPNRNPEFNHAEIEQELTETLGAERILWLKHGHLAGDDTDAHIDTLARLAPDDTLVYVQCDDPEDEHYAALKAMEAELQAFRTREGKPYRLLPLPWPAAKYETDGHRLPATYANFLIINDAVLVPVYNDPSDNQALLVVAQAFPGREIIGIDCSVLIRQHGSLHCITMQIPQGVCL